jgi:hypothetical protein
MADVTSFRVLWCMFHTPCVPVYTSLFQCPNVLFLAGSNSCMYSICSMFKVFPIPGSIQRVSWCRCLWCYMFLFQYYMSLSMFCYIRMLTFTGFRWPVSHCVLYMFLFQVPDDLFPAVCFIYVSCSRFQMTCSPQCALYMFPVPGSRWPVPRGVCCSQMAAEPGVLSWLRGHVHQGTILTQWILSIPAKCGIKQNVPRKSL